VILAQAPDMSGWGVLGAVLAALLAAAGAAFAAVQSRRAQERNVDVQLVQLMQSEVQQLHQRVSTLRTELVSTQDETDEWRSRARRLKWQVDDMERRIDRLVDIVRAAGLDLPDNFDSKEIPS
jgi:peptidoglycan hydrolase CwlO-like protein